MRHASHPIEPAFLNRWSGRAMSGASLEAVDLHRLFEAARWAPSSANVQPWRFLYARAGTTEFERFFELLMEGNRSWCKRAGALLVVLSKSTNDAGAPSPSHSFDAGAAWMSLALQASAMGLVAHGLGGFDRDRARSSLGVPEGWAVECMVALGHPGDASELPEALRAREAPNDRKPIEALIAGGAFPAEWR